MNNVDDSLVEKLWHDLDGQVSREQIGRVVTEIAAGFQKATVTAFVPILIHRRALEQLKGLLYDKSHPVASSAPADDEQCQGKEPPAEYSINQLWRSACCLLVLKLVHRWCRAYRL